MKRPSNGDDDHHNNYKKTHFLYLPSPHSRKKHIVEKLSVLRVESSKDNVCVVYIEEEDYTKPRKLVCYGNIGLFAKHLCYMHDFCKVHKQEIIRRNFVDYIDRTDCLLTLKDGMTISYSRKYAENFLSDISDLTDD